MTIWQSIFLAVLQGFTEFLPISSSGHLVLFQKIFGITDPPVAFDVLLHLGTMIAIFVFLRKQIKEIIYGFFQKRNSQKKKESIKIGLIILIGTIPIIIVGLLLMKKIETIFNSLLLVGISFFLTAIILFSTSLVGSQEKDIKVMGKGDSFFIGLFQALSILPGVSRSGSTISAGFFRGIKREDAFNFSFFLGAVAILGATTLQIPEIVNFNGLEFLTGIIGFFIAFFTGFLALKILKPIVLKGKFYYFGIYCIFVGVICIIFSIM